MLNLIPTVYGRFAFGIGAGILMLFAFMFVFEHWVQALRRISKEPDTNTVTFFPVRAPYLFS